MTMPVLPKPSKDGGDDPPSSSPDEDDDDGKEDRRCEQEEEDVRAMEKDVCDDDDDDDDGTIKTTASLLLTAATIVAPGEERNPAEDGRNNRMRSHGAIVLFIYILVVFGGVLTYSISTSYDTSSSDVFFDMAWLGVVAFFVVDDVEEVSNIGYYLRDARHLLYCFIYQYHGVLGNSATLFIPLQ